MLCLDLGCPELDLGMRQGPGIPKSGVWRAVSYLVTLHIPFAHSHVVNEVIPLGRASN